MKYCSKCRLDKESTLFYKNKSKSDGLSNWCKICTNNDIKTRRHKYKEQDKVYSKKYYIENKQYFTDYNKRYCKQYYIQNKETIKSNVNEYRINNKKKVNKTRLKYIHKQLKINPLFKLCRYLRSRLNQAIKNNFKSGSAVRDLGCTIDQLKIHLESQFQPGMNWDNWSTNGWHIDHIKPLSSFDLTDREELLKAVHYTNLQPLWAVDNLKKGSKHGTI